jgi:hypothetical protein
METDERYERAKRRVKEIKDFYSHLVVYVGVMVILVIVDSLDRGGNWWVFWPALAWGFFVVLHGARVFTPFTRRWEERKIKELMDKDPDQ